MCEQRPLQQSSELLFTLSVCVQRSPITYQSVSFNFVCRYIYNMYMYIYTYITYIHKLLVMSWKYSPSSLFRISSPIFVIHLHDCDRDRDRDRDRDHT